jgi:hypothetical protein
MGRVWGEKEAEGWLKAASTERLLRPRFGACLPGLGSLRIWHWLGRGFSGERGLLVWKL